MSADSLRAKQSLMTHAHEELATPSMVCFVALFCLCLVATMVLLGPMGTGRTLSTVQRFAYYSLNAISVMPICFVSLFFTLYVVKKRAAIGRSLALTLMVLFITMPCTAVSLTNYALFHGGRLPQTPLFLIYVVGVVLVAWGTALTCYVIRLRLSRKIAETVKMREGSGSRPAILTGPAGVVDVAGSEPGQQAHESLDHERPATTAGPTAPDQGAPGEDREVTTEAGVRALSIAVGEDIVYAHVTGHYLDVVTTAGTSVVLMRLSDIKRTLAGQGMQTHRSYWAAFRHFVRLERVEHRTILHLTGGHRVPVSRSFRDAVREFMKSRDDAFDRAGA